MKKQIILGNEELFIIYTRRYLSKLFYSLGYDNYIQDKDSYIIITYSSKKLNQEIQIIYDFLRSDKLYYQIEVQFKIINNFEIKNIQIEPLEYFKDRVIPSTIESIISMIKELFVRYLLEDLKGERGLLSK